MTSFYLAENAPAAKAALRAPRLQTSRGAVIYGDIVSRRLEDFLGLLTGLEQVHRHWDVNRV